MITTSSRLAYAVPKHVTVTGENLDDGSIRAAIDDAGYEVA